jgi:putative membrane protein
MMGGMGFGFGTGFIGLLWMLLFWGGLVAVSIWILTLIFPPSKKRSQDNNGLLSAEEILKARYARGEVTEEQYQRMLQTIRQ